MVYLSSTTTVGTNDLTENNPYKEVAKAFCSGPDIQISEDSKNTYTARSNSKFTGACHFTSENFIFIYSFSGEEDMANV